MMSLHIISLILLVGNTNSQGNLFDFFGLGAGDPFGGQMFNPYMMGTGFGPAAAPQAPAGPDPSMQEARLTMAEEQMAEVMGESAQNSPERQRIDRLIKASGGRFTGDAAPLNYLVQDYLMTTPGTVPSPEPKPMPTRGRKAGKQRQGRRRNRNRQRNGGNGTNQPNGPAGTVMPSPKPTRPTGRIGKQAPYPKTHRNRAVPPTQRQNYQPPPPPQNNHMYQGQPQNNQMYQSQPNNQIYQGQAPPNNQMYQGPPPSNNQVYQGPPPSNNQVYQGPPPSNNQVYQGPLPSNNQIYQGPPPPSNQIYQGPPPKNTKINQGQPPLAYNQGQTKTSRVGQTFKGQNTQRIQPQGNYQPQQGSSNNNIRPSNTKSRQGGPVAARRLKRIEGRISSVNAQLRQARQNNNIAQINELQSQMDALNGVKHILTGGSSQTNSMKTIKGRSNLKPPVQTSPSRQQNNVQYGPPTINRNNQNNLNNGPKNYNNFQETNVGGGKFAQTWKQETPVATKPQQYFQDPYPTAGNGNNQGNAGFNQGNRNLQNPPPKVNIQPYQNVGPTADPYAPYNQGLNQQTAQYNQQAPAYDHGMYQQQPVYDQYAPSYDQGVNQHGAAQNYAPARQTNSRRQGRRRNATPPPTQAPTGTTVAPQLGDIKMIRGEEYIYTDADGYDTFQWIKKSLIPAGQLDHLPQHQEQQQGQKGKGAAAAA